jgi:hypothetical protein
MLTRSRRLSVAVGQPLSLSKQLLNVARPSKMPGFADPNAMNINISICQITGRIMESEDFYPLLRNC